MRSNFFTDWKVLFFGAGTLGLAITLFNMGPELSLDGRFYYSHDQALKLLDQLSPKDKEQYLLKEFIDLFFIFFYSSFLYVALSRLYNKNLLGIKYLGLVPGVFDFFETKSIILVLNQTLGSHIFYWLGSITAAKWCFGVLCALLVAVGLLIRLNFFKFTQASQ